MLIQQIIEFQSKGPGPAGRSCTVLLQQVNFMTKQKFLKKIFKWIIIIYGQNIVGGNATYFPHLGQITYKIQHQNVRF